MTRTQVLRIIDLGEVSYLETQSVYHAVAACMDEKTPDTVILCRPDSPYLCFGYHQSSLQVLDEVAVQNAGYPVMRRRLGGGLTYLDRQQQFYQCVFHRSRSPVIPARVYASRLNPPISTLRKMGLWAELRYTNEIEISGRRIAGIGGGIISEASVVVGNVLNDFEYEAMAGILNVPCREFRELALWAMRQRITTLKLERRDNAWTGLAELLIDAYESEFNMTAVHDELTDRECNEALRQAEIMTEKDYLAQTENIDTSDVLPLSRLKISGSTSIHLIALKLGSHLNYAVLVLRDGVVEKWKVVEELSEQLSDGFQRSGIATYETGEIEIGRVISL